MFDTLYSVKGADGSPAKFTLDTVVSNPDFSKIKDSGYREMHTETLFQTAEKYPNHDRVEHLYKEGISKGLIKPQFHGLQHIHANNWLNALASGETAVLDAFDEEMITVHQHNKTRCSEFYLDAWAMHTNQDIKNISEELTEGLKLFESLFGFRSVSAIPPCFKMTEDVLAVLSETDVNHIQAALYQQSIDDSSRKRHYTGEKNQFGQFYTVRNVNFEPSLMPNKDWISEVLQDVYWAFFWGKPAIINTHRLNFVGSLSEKNRDQNLKLLREILKRITQRWPEAEFVTSNRLGEVFE